MTDLFDEMGKKSSENVSTKVTQLGGDLFDEVGVKQNRPELMSKSITQVDPARLDAERQKLIDELNAELSVFERFLVGAGRGLTTIGRGLGLVDQEDAATQRAFTDLAEDSIAAQAGQIVGEAAPFLAVAPLAGSGLTTTAGRTLIPAAKSLAGRMLGAGLLGATEGGTVARGGGGDVTDTLTGAGFGGAIGAGIELVMPVLGRLVSAVFARVGRQPTNTILDASGRPTAEFQKVLDETGTSFDDLTEQAFAIVKQTGLDEKQAARAARFESLGVPATAGDITQDTGQQAVEQRLISQVGSDASEPLRQLKLEQSEIFKGRVEELVDSLGVPSATGDNVKKALLGRKKLLRKEKNQFYKEAFNASPEVANIPIFSDSLVDALADPAQHRRISRLAPTQAKALDELLVEFGIDTTEEAVAAFDGQITPLSVGNFEDFRQAINQIERADQTGSIKVLTSPIKTALDAESELIDTAIKNSDVRDAAVLDLFKQGRDRTKTLKTEFSPESVTGKLIGVRRDGVTPVIEASKVTNTLLSPNAPIEHLQRTLTSLSKSGEKGQRAIKDLQASVVLNALENALKAPSNKTSGVQLFGGNQFAKSLDKFGDDKLKLLFQDDPKSLSRLKNLRQTAKDITPSATATPKGSAPVILDIVKQAGSFPGIAAVRDVAKFVLDAGSDDRAVRKALNSSPKMKKVAAKLEKDFPAIATALGVSMASKPEENE